MKIPFTLDAWLKDKSQKVVDEDGDSVDPRICRLGWLLERQDNLFIITSELELNEWQTFISGCLQKHGLLDCGAADRIAKECSAELLELARNQLQKEGLVTMEHMNKACEAEYQSGLADGKNEAMKDLPRWEKCDWPTPRIGAHVDNEGRLIYCCRYVALVELTEKLPGFKEDEQ